MTRHVEIDPDLCVGSADCTLIAPEAFALDEDEGVATVLTGADVVPADLLHRAVRACPTGAISVEGDG